MITILLGGRGKLNLQLHASFVHLVGMFVKLLQQFFTGFCVIKERDNIKFV